MINRRGLRGPVGRERAPSATVGESPGDLFAPGYGEQAPVGGSLPPFDVDARGPFDMSKDPDNAPFRELFRKNIAEFVSGIVAVYATVQPTLSDPTNTSPNIVVHDEVRIIGYLAGTPFILMIGAVGTPPVTAAGASAGSASGPVVYQWSAEDDGESYDEIAVEARQNTISPWVPPATINLLSVSLRLWRGRA